MTDIACETTPSNDSRLLWEETLMETSSYVRLLLMNIVRLVIQSQYCLLNRAVDGPRQFIENETLRSFHYRNASSKQTMCMGGNLSKSSERHGSVVGNSTSGAGWGKLPHIPMYLSGAMDIAARCGGYVAIGIDAYILPAGSVKSTIPKRRHGMEDQLFLIRP